MGGAHLTTCRILHSDGAVMRWAERFCTWLAAVVWLVLVYLSLCLLSKPAHAAGLEVTKVAKLPTCTNGSPWAIAVVDGNSSTDCSTGSGTTEVICACLDGSRTAISGGGGSGDITDVWSDATGDVSALTAAAGDTLDAGSADASSPTTRSTSLPGTCSEGQHHQDTDSGGSETYVCTAANTWTKLTTSTDIIGVTLDIGDDGGNDSTGITEIATENDDYTALIEESADKATLRFDKIPPYRQYDVDRPPSSCATCEEWTGDAAAQTWAWENQESSTETIGLDGNTLIHPADSTGFAVRYLTNGPDGSATDFVISTKVTLSAGGASNLAGIFVLISGTAASPTLIHTCAVAATSGDSARVQYQSWTSYTSAATTLGTMTAGVINIKAPQPVYLQFRYVSSTKTPRCWASMDGIIFRDTGYGSNLGAHPTTTMGMAIGAFSVGEPGGGHFYYWRARSDATGTSSPYPVGE